MKKLLLFFALSLLLSQAFAEQPAAPPFTLTDAAGNEVALPRSHGGVDIYLFWASWCPYCKALMQHLQSIQIEYGDDVSIYALHIRDNADPEIHIDDQGYDFTLLPDADSVMALYDVQPVPALFLVDGKGIIRFNLYDMIFNDSSEFKAMSHGKKAARRAPYWAAEIRHRLDQILADTKND